MVLIGESTHGTEEFYRIRARITQELIEHEGFDFVAVEADWPDAYSINRFVQSSQSGSIEEAFQNFERFPQWMWKNNACADFADWLRAFNSNKVDSSKVGFFGLDMYSMYRSMDKVLEYLQHVDPQAASAASERYEALDEYRNNPFDYARDVYLKLIPEQASNVLEVLLNLLSNVPEYMRGRGGFIDGDELFYTIQNAQLVVDAEEYYRATLTGKNSWNLRDTHMFRTLKLLLAHHQKKKLASSSQIERYDGRPIRCVVWAHNSHVGDERASAIAEHRGQINLGQLVREEFGLSKTYIIGFSTYQGTVLAARHWDTPGRVFELNKGVDGSVEALLHSFVAQAQFFSRTTPGSSANNDFIVYFRVNSATSAAQVPDTTDHLQAGQSKEIQTSENKQNEEVRFKYRIAQLRFRFL